MHLSALYVKQGGQIDSTRPRILDFVQHRPKAQVNVSLTVCDLRLQGLEKKILIEAGETPAVVYEMKKQVDSFREKLEVWTKCLGALKLLVKFWQKRI